MPLISGAASATASGASVTSGGSARRPAGKSKLAAGKKVPLNEEVFRTPEERHAKWSYSLAISPENTGNLPHASIH